MINNRQQTGRRRGRGGQRPAGSTGGGGGMGRAPEMGNRIDNRARGNASQLLEKYKTLARDAQQAGDRVLAEYYLQFADHYFRVLAESRARFDEANPRRAQAEYSDSGDGYDDSDDGEGDDADDEFAPPRQQQARPPQDRSQQRNDRPQRNDRNDGQRNDAQREDRPQRVARDDRPQGNEGQRYESQRNDTQRNDSQRNDGQRDDRPQREPRIQRDEGVRDDRPRQQPREDRPVQPAVETEVAEIYRDESAARDERPVREERPTRDGTRRRLGMHSTANGSGASEARAPAPAPVEPVRDNAEHDGDHALPLDVLPPSISATVSASIAATEDAPAATDLPEGVEGEVVAPAPRRRGRPRKVVPEVSAED